MSPYKRPSIDDKGLKNHLNDRPMILGMNCYDLYVYMVRRGINNTGISKMLGISNHTASKWRRQYKKEEFENANS